MTDRAFADTPIAIDRVDRARGDGDGIRFRLSGRWLGSGRVQEHEPLLVIQLSGRRHRFPADRDDGPDPLLPSGTWAATFMVPSWAEPSRDGQAALWVGNDVVPVLLGGSAADPVSPGDRQPPAPAPAGPVTAEPDPRPPVPPPLAEPVVDSGRPGPLAELLFKESVAALHAELEQRAAEAARLRGALSVAQSELDARTAMQATLESAHADLRGELQDLMSAVTVQREDFERRFTDVEKRLAAAESERDGLREELESERARAQRELESVRADAERELGSVRADAERELGSVRADAERELGSVRADAARQLESARAGTEHELASARAETVALSERLAAATGTHRQHADELSALREQLAAAQVSRDAAAGEVAGLRAELERLGSELAVSREQMAAEGGDLGEAQRLLADARALTEQLRGQNSQ
jgi:hypothetical protein